MSTTRPQWTIMFAVLTSLVTWTSPSQALPVRIPPDSAGVERLNERFQSTARVRVLGRMGVVELRKPTATPEGVQARSSRRHRPGSAPPEPPIPWSAIDGIQIQVTRAAVGALIGAVPCAWFGGLIAAVTSSGGLSNSGSGAAAVVGGVAGGAALGAMVGAPIGTGFKRWRLVAETHAAADTVSAEAHSRSMTRDHP